MRNNRLRHKSNIVRRSILVILFLTLFTMMSFTAPASAQQRQGSGSPLVASLQLAPSGRADLRWNPQRKVLTVITTVSGLRPGSNLAEYIHTGTCAKRGNILYPLKNIVVDRTGKATVTSPVPNVNGGIPPTGWNITLHSGPTAQASTLLCGNVANPKGATSIAVPLSATPAIHQKAGEHH